MNMISIYIQDFQDNHKIRNLAQYPKSFEICKVFKIIKYPVFKLFRNNPGISAVLVIDTYKDILNKYN